MQRNAHMGDRRVTPTRRVTAGDSVTTVVTSHVSHGCSKTAAASATASLRSYIRGSYKCSLTSFSVPTKAFFRAVFCTGTFSFI